MTPNSARSQAILYVIPCCRRFPPMNTFSSLLFDNAMYPEHKENQNSIMVRIDNIHINFQDLRFIDKDFITRLKQTHRMKRLQASLRKKVPHVSNNLFYTVHHVGTVLLRWQNHLQDVIHIEMLLDLFQWAAALKFPSIHNCHVGADRFTLFNIVRSNDQASSVRTEDVKKKLYRIVNSK